MARSAPQLSRDGNPLRSFEHATVADAMHPGIVSCSPDATAQRVASLMANHRLHCIFVMHSGFENRKEPYVWGIVSDLDLVRAALRADDGQTAGSLAGQPMVSVKATMPLTDACALMVKHGVNHLVVLDPSALRPIGVLSTTDVAELLAPDET